MHKHVCVHVSANVCGVYAQGGVAEPADRTREVNERLLAEVRRRLQEAKSQLHTGAGAGAGAGAGSPDEVDAGTPVDSPLGGRPKVLQGQASSGTYNYNSNPCILALTMLCCLELILPNFLEDTNSCTAMIDIRDHECSSCVAPYCSMANVTNVHRFKQAA